MASWLSPNDGFGCMRLYLPIDFLTGISDEISFEVANIPSMWLSCSLGISGGRSSGIVSLGGSGTVPTDTLPTVV